MGNNNSSHRHRPHITDPLPLDSTWTSNGYPGPDMNNLKGRSPDEVDHRPAYRNNNRSSSNSSYDQFDQECIQHQLQQQHPDGARFARYFSCFFHAPSNLRNAQHIPHILKVVTFLFFFFLSYSFCFSRWIKHEKWHRWLKGLHPWATFGVAMIQIWWLARHANGVRNSRDR